MKLFHLAALLFLSHLVMGQNSNNTVSQLNWERLGLSFNTEYNSSTNHPNKDIVNRMMFSHFITNSAHSYKINQKGLSSYSTQVKSFEEFKQAQDAYEFGKARKALVSNNQIPSFILNDPQSLRNIEGNAAQYRWQIRNQRREQFRNFSQEWEGEGVDIGKVMNWNWFNW